MKETRSIIEHIEDRLPNMSKGHRHIARFILGNYDKAAFMTAARLGNEVGVSESTVVRFAGALGFEGYPELQKSLQEAVRGRLTLLQRMELAGNITPEMLLQTVLKADMDNIRSTIEYADTAVFNTVVERMQAARTIYVMGLRSAAPLAQFLGYYLNFVFPDVRRLTTDTGDICELLLRIGEGDLFVGISFPRYSRQTAKALRFAKEQGACTVAITDGPASPIYAVSDHCLFSRSDMDSFVDSLVAPLSLINALVVAVSLQEKEGLFEYFSKLEKIYDEHEIYTNK
ncbi:MAG: MurR/RpiR family transcriptional regulator [Christensenellales bacterium]|jgi:DNA-binding MurR/RpiR family transcriptional regulator